MRSHPDHEAGRADWRGGDVAGASLASLYLLRERLLPDLVASLPGDAAALNRVVASHRRDWLDAAMPAATLPERLLLSNIAAFLVHAMEQRNPSATEAEAKLAAWFDDETSILFGHRSRQDRSGTFVRRYCCVRYLVPGQRKCRTCPLFQERPRQAG